MRSVAENEFERKKTEWIKKKRIAKNNLNESWWWFASKAK